MTRWHETLTANIGLRAGGLALLGSGWSAALRLHQMALITPVRDMTSGMMFLAAVAFICGSAGSALLCVGPGLWERVEVSERWRPLSASGHSVPGTRGVT